MGTLNVLFVILAVRLTLVIAIVGALILARAALVAPIPMQQPALVVVAIYCVTVVIPIVWLASRR